MIFYGLISGLVIGVLLVIIGYVGLVFSNTFSDLTEMEVELMKKDGKFEGEPDYMQKFRVARSEYDLEDDRKNIKYSKIIMYTGYSIMGICIILLSIYLIFFQGSSQL